MRRMAREDRKSGFVLASEAAFRDGDPEFRLWAWGRRLADGSAKQRAWGLVRPLATTAGVLKAVIGIAEPFSGVPAAANGVGPVVELGA